MALINDPRIYSGGSERIDTRPHTQLYAQLKQREQARNDAFDEYVRGLNKSINPQGLRNVDRPAFEQKLKEWQDFGIKNKELLRNPRKDMGETSMRFQSGYQQLLNDIAESKGEEEKKKPLVEVMTDPNKRDRLSEDLLPDIESHDQPLYIEQEGQIVRNPNRKSFDVSRINYDPKPFEQDKFFKGLDDVKPSQTSEERVKNQKDLTETVTTTSVFGKGDKDVIASRAVAEFGQNKSFKEFVKQLDPAEYNDIFKEAYGTDIQDYGDLAAAYALKGKQQSSRVQKIEEDKFGQAKELERIKNANRRGLLAYKSQLDESDEAANDLWYDSYIEQVTNDAKKNPSKLHPGAGLGWEIPLDPFLVKNLANGNVTPDKLVITTEGKYVPIFYKRDDKGEVMIDEQSSLPKENKSYTFPMERNQLKVSLGGRSGVKQLNREMSADKKGSPASSSQKTKTVEIIRGELD